jgi:hypothetical protein
MVLEDIDPNRGLICKPLPNAGPLISMCKTVPGVYFDASGDPATDEMAERAGFDVAGDRIVMEKNAAKAQAIARIDAQFAQESAKIDEEYSELNTPSGSMAPSVPAAQPAAAPGVDDGAPFIEKTGTGEPRVARTVQGGIVKVMEYVQKDTAWKVYDRDTGETIDDGLDKDDAVELLLAED